jgi:hypothetical protein
MIIKPLHIGTVAGRTLRFFRTPLNDGRPDFPWHSFDDLNRCPAAFGSDAWFDWIKAAMNRWEGH